MSIDDDTALDRFWPKVHKANTGCWLWTGAVRADGYARFLFRGEVIGAHRASYEMFVGPIPGGLHLDHLCRVRHCVNPEHLEPVTCLENVRRGEGGQATGARHRSLTHCPRGHEYSEANTYFCARGWRQCRTCKAAASVTREQRRKRARASNSPRP